MVEFHCQADDYDFAGSQTQALIELKQENTKLRNTITRQKKAIRRAAREVLAWKAKFQELEQKLVATDLEGLL